MPTIKLTKGFETEVDQDDWLRLCGYKWHIVKSRGGIYAGRSKRIGKHFIKILMHRIIMNCPDGLMVDHKNGKTLDNRKENLEICTNSENIKRGLERLRKEAKERNRLPKKPNDNVPF